MLHDFTPASSIRTRLLLAASIWTIVGVVLLVVGASWTLHDRRVSGWGALVLGLLLGWLKGRYMLSGRASENVRRILEAGEDRCLGGVFAWSAWALVLAMMAAGALLRHSSLPRMWLGAIYAAVGTALIGASSVSWRAWNGRRRGAAGPPPSTT